jgi:hypothetical protein
MPEQTRTPAFIDGLYGKLLERRNQLLFPIGKLATGRDRFEPY